jgi:hypothetical protein
MHKCVNGFMLFAYRRQIFPSSINDCCYDFHFWSLLLDSSSHFHTCCSFSLDLQLLFLSVKVTIVVPFGKVTLAVPFD